MYTASRKQIRAESVAASLVAIAGATLFTILLCRGVIESLAYWWLLALTAVISLVLHGFSRVRELSVGELKVLLDRIEEAKAEVYAREETVKALAEHIAGIAVFTATDQIPLLMPSWLVDERYQREVNRMEVRDRIVSILKEVSADGEQIQDATDMFDSVVRERLFVLLHSYLHAHVNKHLQERDIAISKESIKKKEELEPKTKEERQALVDDVNRKHAALKPLREFGSRENLAEVIKSLAYDAEKIGTALKEKGIWDETIEKHLTTYGEFVREHNIDMAKLETAASVKLLTHEAPFGAA